MMPLLARTVGRMNQIWRTYVIILERHPARAHAFNTCLLMGSGDVIAQLALERRSIKDYDILRTARFALVGGVLAGPGMHVWYTALDRWFVRGSVAALAVRKTIADQAFFLPVYLGVYVTVMGLLRGDRLDGIKAKVGRDFGPMLIASYSIWPAVQLFNFAVIPLQHRILLINIVALFWNSYIGWQAERTLIHSPPSPPHPHPHHQQTQHKQLQPKYSRDYGDYEDRRETRDFGDVVRFDNG